MPATPSVMPSTTRAGVSRTGNHHAPAQANVTAAATKPHAAPSTVLPGLTAGASRLLPNRRPP